MFSAPPTLSRNNGEFLPRHSEVNSNERGKIRTLFTVLDVSTLVLIMFSYVPVFV